MVSEQDVNCFQGGDPRVGYLVGIRYFFIPTNTGKYRDSCTCAKLQLYFIVL